MFARIQRMQTRFDKLCQKIEKGFEALPEEKGMAEIKAAVQAARYPSATDNK